MLVGVSPVALSALPLAKPCPGVLVDPLPFGSNEDRMDQGIDISYSWRCCVPPVPPMTEEMKGKGQARVRVLVVLFCRSARAGFGGCCEGARRLISESPQMAQYYGSVSRH